MACDDAQLAHAAVARLVARHIAQRIGGADVACDVCEGFRHFVNLVGPEELAARLLSIRFSSLGSPSRSPRSWSATEYTMALDELTDAIIPSLVWRLALSLPSLTMTSTCRVCLPRASRSRPPFTALYSAVCPRAEF